MLTRSQALKKQAKSLIAIQIGTSALSRLKDQLKIIKDE